MSTALYRINGGEVLKVSLQNQDFSAADATYFGILTDPTLTDGSEVQEDLGDGTLGPRRALGFAKFANVGGNEVRNATQPEIDAWAAAETADRNLRDRDLAERRIDNEAISRKVFIALGRVLVQEFNILRALHSLPDRTLTQLRNALRNELSEDD